MISKIIDHCEYNDDTLNLAIYLYDFYNFKIKEVNEKNETLILIITCILISSKFYELRIVSIRTIMKLISVQNTEYIRDEIYDIEAKILISNEFKLNKVNDKDILKRIILLENLTNECYTIASLLLELSVYYSKYFEFKPTEKAIAAIEFVIEMFGRKNRFSKLNLYIKYDSEKVNFFKQVIYKVIQISKQIKLELFKKIEDKKFAGLKFKELLSVKLV